MFVETWLLLLCRREEVELNRDGAREEIVELAVEAIGS